MPARWTHKPFTFLTNWMAAHLSIYRLLCQIRATKNLNSYRDDHLTHPFLRGNQVLLTPACESYRPCAYKQGHAPRISEIVSLHSWNSKKKWYAFVCLSLQFVENKQRQLRPRFDTLYVPMNRHRAAGLGQDRPGIVHIRIESKADN